MLNLFFWLTFGFLGGWTVALIAQPEANAKRIGGSGLLGAVGGLFGGALTQHLSHQSIIDGFNGPSILAAVIVAVIFASIFNALLNR